MSPTLLSSLLALSLLWSVSPVTHAQTQDWQQLPALKPGTEILIEFKGGLRDPFNANFSSAYDDVLLVRQDGLPITFKQRDIQRVYSLKGKWSRSEMAKIGAGIGLVGGFLIGMKVIADRESRGHVAGRDADLSPAIAGLFIGSVAGGGLGALAGGKRKSKLLYEAK
jgi:hypothetical protein